MKIYKVIFLPIVIAAIYCISVQSGFTRKDEKMQLIEVVKLGRGNDMRNLFLVYIINPNYVDADGHSPLYYAVTSGNLDTIEILLNNGADPNYLVKYQGDTVTPLQLAYRTLENQQALSVIEFLLKEGKANPNSIDKNGNSLLHEAVRRKNRTLVSLLIRFGANVMLPNKKGETPLSLADKKMKRFIQEVQQGRGIL